MQILPAQQFEWSNLERFRNKTAYNKIIGSNQFGYYMIRSRDFDLRNRVIIERYRESLGKDFSKKLHQKRGVDLVNAFVSDLGINLWKSSYNNDIGRLELFVELLDEDAEALGQPIRITSAVPKNYSDDGDFVVLSNNYGTHFLVMFSELAPKGKTYLNVQVYDHRFEMISSRREEMGFEGQEFEIDKAIVDTTGNAFVLVSGVNPDHRKATPERVGVHLFSLTNRGDWFDFYLNEAETFLHSPIMELDDVNNRLVVSGLYSYESRDFSKGILDFSLDRHSFRIEHHEFVPFNTEFIKGIAGERAAQDGAELRDFVIRYMVTRSDGGFMVFGEEFSIAEQSYTYYANGIAQVSSRSVYNYGKIFVMSNNRDAQNDWIKIINKGQSSVNDFGYYSSFTIYKKKDRIHILFNDKLRGNGGVINYMLFNDDTLEEDLLFGNQGSFISIVPGETKQLDANTLLIPTSKDRKFALVKVIF